MEHKRRVEIDEEIGEDPGTASYLRKYAGAVSKVVGHLSEDRKADYLELAARWNNAGPPREVQIRFVIYLYIQASHLCYCSQCNKYAGPLAHSFIEMMEKQYGAKIVMFMGYVTPQMMMKFTS